MTKLTHVGGHFDEQSIEQVKRCVGELGAWALGSAEALENHPPGCGWGLAAAGQELHLYTLPATCKQVAVRQQSACNHNC